METIKTITEFKFLRTIEELCKQAGTNTSFAYNFPHFDKAINHYEAEEYQNFADQLKGLNEVNNIELLGRSLPAKKMFFYANTLKGARAIDKITQAGEQLAERLQRPIMFNYDIRKPFKEPYKILGNSILFSFRNFSELQEAINNFSTTN